MFVKHWVFDLAKDSTEATTMPTVFRISPILFFSSRTYCGNVVHANALHPNNIRRYTTKQNNI